ncbi:hypothetical protein U9M48_002060 [Paspalum notatum var. saurae]|uniref:Epidermal patterning factor-like protein n=1 Tax=Paspalum notatum var. saurae TaxID=547442 RepID=A0AAQ3PJ67_PASNO
MVGAVSCRRRHAAAALLAAVLLAAAMVATTVPRGRRIDSSSAAAVGTAAATWAADGGSLPLPRRRWLAGPGSSPPTCRARCGRCAPCRATRVAIQPGAVGPQWEYYPEVWRCKCGNKLFMP